MRSGRVVALAVAGVVAVAGVAGAATPSYQMVPVYSGADTFYPTGINNAGTVVGYGESYYNGWTYQVMTWRDGQAYPAILGKGWGINNDGVIAGEGKDGQTYGGFYSSVSEGITSLASEMYQVKGIANNGLVAGQTGYGTAVKTYKPGWTTVKDFGRPQDSDEVDVTGVNSAGMVIGVATKEGDFNEGGGWSKAFFIGTEPGPTSGTGAFVPRFGFLPGFGSDEGTEASDINERGVVAGSTEGKAVIWATRPQFPTSGGVGGFTITPQNLGSLYGGDFGSSAARGLNERNQVVGYSFTAEGRHGFLWSNGRMVDLNSLVPEGTGYTIREGVAINDNGQIVAIARRENDSHNYTVVLNPNYGSSQEVALRPTTVEQVGGMEVGHFVDAQSGQWFDPDPTGHVHVEMEGDSLFTQILELPYGFGPMTVSVGGNVIGTFGAGDLVELGGVSAFDVTWDQEGIFGDFPLKLAFNTDTADFRIETLSVVPEPAVVGLLAAIAPAMGRLRRRR